MGFYDALVTPPQSPATQEMYSITTAKVVENYDDKHPGMVKVELFMGESGKNQSDWVRVAQPYAGKGYGTYFLPEIGDEVVVAFNQGNRDNPIVLGGLWNQVDTVPPDTAVENNTIKRIQTKGGHQIVFNDESGKETLSLQTPKGFTLLLDDENQTIDLKDGDGKNMVTIDGSNGTVTVQADKKLVLDVGGSGLTLDGTGKSATLKMDNIIIEAGQGLTLKGQNVKVDGAMVAVAASGNGEFTASGVLTLKGAMAKIN
ncbi:MAG: phage baseplate assembly protein V [Eubacteriales bacterium]